MAPTAASARAINTQTAGSVATVWATPPNEGLGLGPEGAATAYNAPGLPKPFPLNHAVLACAPEPEMTIRGRSRDAPVMPGPPP